MAERPVPTATEAPRGTGLNAAETAAFSVAALVFSLGMSLITARYLLPTGRGAYALGLLIVSLVGTALGNIGAAVTHQVGRHAESAREIVWHGLLVSVALGAFASALALALNVVLVDADHRNTALAAAALPAMLVSQTLSGALLPLHKLRLWNALQLLVPATVLAATVALVMVADRGLGGAIVAWTGAQLVVGVVAVLATRRIWWPPTGVRFERRRARDLTVLGLKLGGVNVVGTLNYRIEFFVLNAFSGLHAVGIYSLATSLAELVWLPGTALGTATVGPIVTTTDAEARAQSARAVRLVIAGTALMGLAVAVGGALLIPVVFGDAFADARTPLAILLVGVVAFAPAKVLGNYFSLRHGTTRYPLATAIVSGLVTAALSVVLVPPLGAPGAALASGLGYCVGIVLELRWFLRQSKQPVSAVIPRPADLRAYWGLARSLVTGARARARRRS